MDTLKLAGGSEEGRARPGVLVLALVLVLVTLTSYSSSASGAPAARWADRPHIAQVTQQRARPDGTEVLQIHGDNFARGDRVVFGGRSAWTEVHSRWMLTALLPARRPQRLRLAIRIGRARSNIVAVQVDRPVRVWALSRVRLAVAGGQTVQVRGEGLRDVRRVLFGASPGRDLRHVGDTLLVRTPPHGATTARLRLVGTFGRYASRVVTRFFAKPRIAWASEQVGSTTGGNLIAITGTTLDPAWRVTFGGAAAHVVSDSPGRLVVRVPAHPAGQARIVVDGPGGLSPASQSTTYAYLATSLPLSTGPVGAAVDPTAVSCPASQKCIAVTAEGDAYVYSEGQTWGPTQIDGRAALVGISCPTTVFCVAIDASGNVLMDTNGSWSTPTPTDRSGFLTAVSCASASFCAIGDGEGRVSVWNGTMWSSMHQIDATGLPIAQLSCPTSSFCAADDSGGDFVTYRGGAWSNPVAGVGPFTGLSCATAKFCVGLSPSHARTFNGTSWSGMLSLDAGFLDSLSCAGTSCIAVNVTGDAIELHQGSWSAARPADAKADGPVVSACSGGGFCLVLDVFGTGAMATNGSWLPVSLLDAKPIATGGVPTF